MTTDRDWLAWHEPYDRADSSLARRLEVVQRRIAEMLDTAPPGPVRCISMCAGQGRDLLGVVARHPHGRDVTGRLVERDERNVAFARQLAASAGINDGRIEIIAGDASTTTPYAGAVPADLVLVCGVFGNISDADIRTTIETLPGLCAAGATVLWTRHRKEPDLTPMIGDWFRAAGFDEVAFDSAADAMFGVGTNRLVAPPRPFESGIRMFDFTGDGRAANC